MDYHLCGDAWRLNSAAHLFSPPTRKTTDSIAKYLVDGLTKTKQFKHRHLFQLNALSVYGIVNVRVIAVRKLKVGRGITKKKKIVKKCRRCNVLEPRSFPNTLTDWFLGCDRIVTVRLLN